METLKPVWQYLKDTRSVCDDSHIEVLDFVTSANKRALLREVFIYIVECFTASCFPVLTKQLFNCSIKAHTDSLVPEEEPFRIVVLVGDLEWGQLQILESLLSGEETLSIVINRVHLYVDTLWNCVLRGYRVSRDWISVYETCLDAHMLCIAIKV